MSTIRFGGAQIPCTPYIARNIQTIKTAIDWAADNDVEYLVTPEASLSGYTTTFADGDALVNGLQEIETYAASKAVGLCLGTLWVENGPLGNESALVKRNQIRYYTKDGIYLGATHKTVNTPLDAEIGVEANDTLIGVWMPAKNDKDVIIPVAGLICADLYGLQCGPNGGLPEQYYKLGAKLLIHSTNADRGTDLFKDDLEDLWLDANLRRVSYLLLPVISVDNCYHMDGSEYHGKTATQSGVLIGGKWVTSVPRFGTQYFYHDFSIESIQLSGPLE